MAKAGEFTQRAFINGRFDLAQAEAVADLINAETDAALQAAINQMRGGFSGELKALKDELVHFASMIELEALQTDWHKPFLEIAPYLIIVFKKMYNLDEEGNKSNNYYVTESVGLACGFLLAAIHQAGLVALTHTPSPMGFLSEILARPKNEKPFLLIPVGYPVENTYVPQLERKPIESTAVYYE